MRLTKKSNKLGYCLRHSSISANKCWNKLGKIEDILDGHNIKTLEELDGLLWYVKQIKNIEEEFNINDINELRTCLENEQKGTEYFEDWWNKRFEELLKPKVEALKIIKKKRVNVDWLLETENVEEYNESLYNDLTQEEYDLLKEVLL